MQASNVTRESILAAAEQVGVRAEVDTLNSKGTRHRVKLYPVVPADALTASGRRRRGDKGHAKYQRVSVSFYGAGRRVHAVCWHGFRDFFRAVFEREPGAIFRTSLDTWRGSEDFEARFAASGHVNIGPRISPVPWASACECGEEGYAG